jgi:3-oxoacyl-[acyl-carrier protein] reductase
MQKNIIITGAAHGIGNRIAKDFYNKGYNVTLLDIDLEEMQSSFRDFNKDRILIEKCDVSNYENVKNSVQSSLKKFSSIDILVNNAGVGGPFHLVDEVSEEEWNWIFGVNLKSVFYLCKEVLPEMKKQNFGRIINIASIQGIQGAVRSSTYIASKHAVIGYTKAIACEWGEFNITSNAIAPGYINTRMGLNEAAPKEFHDKVMLNTPVKKVGQPDDISNAVAFLADESSKYINGTVLVVDGGITSFTGI